MNIIKKKYIEEIVPLMTKKFNYSSPMQTPKLQKIVINMGIGSASKNKNHLEDAINELSIISGQKPIATIAKNSNASFKIRDGMKLGCKVTLRDERMYNFIEKLINFVLPQTRDFQGLNPHSFDANCNYSLGIKEQIIFPEIKYENVKRIQGMDISFVITTSNQAEAKFLMEQFGFIFKDTKKETQ